MSAAAELQTPELDLSKKPWAKFIPSRPSRGLTVEKCARKWLFELLDMDKPGAEAYGSHFETRIFEAFGDMLVEDLETCHIRAWVLSLRKGATRANRRHGPPGRPEKLAPRTIRGYYATLRVFCSYAMRQGQIDQNPCTLRGDDLPANVDKDPNWRATAVFERGEVFQLLGLAPTATGFETEQRWRVVYALGLLAGLRSGEISALTIGDWQRRREPLGELTISKSYRAHKKRLGGTKTGATLSVPVHPALEAILADWVDSGWEKVFGRPPREDDLLVPGRSRAGEPRHLRQQEVRRKLGRDLARMNLRDRRFHDTRKTFISLVQADGAIRDIVRRATHARRKEVYDGYTEVTWEQLCNEVAKLKIPTENACSSTPSTPQASPPETLQPAPKEHGASTAEPAQTKKRSSESSSASGASRPPKRPKPCHPRPRKRLKAGRGWVYTEPPHPVSMRTLAPQLG